MIGIGPASIHVVLVVAAKSQCLSGPRVPFPTLFVFDTQGRLVYLHLGEITLPSLTDKMLRHFGLFEN
ncbi:MAG: hypothetical protein KKB60_00260 [Gammaproteobacteria bacterium]|nr:hypothetical protein [Gammaproteobacteria bacterium]MBU1527595.1 hypothetical protein [Gammaproteobacteria bacterium]MBU2211562.1 hypothetical protein [Gammaproteobacteria bacterium]